MPTTAAAGLDPAYPVPDPGEHDPRFTLGLTLDVAAVLTRHGYPPPRAGADLLRLQQALRRSIYRRDDT